MISIYLCVCVCVTYLAMKIREPFCVFEFIFLACLTDNNMALLVVIMNRKISLKLSQKAPMTFERVINLKKKDKKMPIIGEIREENPSCFEDFYD